MAAACRTSPSWNNQPSSLRQHVNTAMMADIRRQKVMCFHDGENALDGWDLGKEMIVAIQEIEQRCTLVHAEIGDAVPTYGCVSMRKDQNSLRRRSR